MSTTIINPLVIILIYLCLKLFGLVLFPELLIGHQWGHYYFLLSVLLVLLFLYNVRKHQKKVRFRYLIISVFLIFFAIAIIGYAMDYYIVNISDPHLIQVMAQEELIAGDAEMRARNATNSTTIEDMENLIRQRYSIWGIMKSLLIYLPFMIIMSVLLSLLFIKKETF